MGWIRNLIGRKPRIDPAPVPDDDPVYGGLLAEPYDASRDRPESSDADTDWYGFEQAGRSSPKEGENRGDDDVDVDAAATLPGEPAAWARPLFWTMALAEPFSFRTDLSQPEVDIVSHFLARLSLVMDHRGAVLDADTLLHVAENLSPGNSFHLLNEIWMSRRKRSAGEAVELGRTLVRKVVDEFGFERLVAAGLPPAVARTEDELFTNVFDGETAKLKSVIAALRRMRTPLSETMATSLDYVIACRGDRGAMARIADRLEAACSARVDGRDLFDGLAYNGMVVTADTWRRLSVATFAGEDGHDLLSERMASRRFSLVDFRKDELGINLLIAPASEDALSSMAYLANFRRLKDAGLVAGMAGPTSVTARKPSAPSDAVISPQRVIGSQETPSSVRSQTGLAGEFRVLDMIGGDEKGDAARTFGNLLDPIPASMPPEPDEVYSALMREFPWMAEANRAAAMSAALSMRSRERVFRMAPMVLVGPPGIGKTRWARRVSELSGTRSHVASLSGLASSKSIVGSERGWHSARPPLPALAFAATRVANPLVLVDEVDKSHSSHNGDPVEGLLPMLTRETAVRYPDAYLLGNLDLMRVTFVFTANSAAGLSQPFLDRVKLVNVGRPSARDYPGIVNAMLEETMASFAFTPEEEEGLEGSIRSEGISALERGRSMRGVEETIRSAVADAVWKPKVHLSLVD